MSHLKALKALVVEGIEENVQVNQRHLIDKILARYSAQYTIFRELLQNSNDADAQNVEIHFNTCKDSKTFLWFTTQQNIESILYKNDGRQFTSDDFSRLRKIAEGNPDEQKIGFFGVGFYSLFSVCEEPFISSGEDSLGFFWKGDMLYTRRGKIPKENVDKWITFYLACRDPIPVPDKNEFARFLSTSMAFLTKIKTVSVFVDDQKSLFLERKAPIPRPIDISTLGSFSMKSPNSLFHLQDILMAKVQLDVTIADKTLTVYMRVATCNVKATLPKALVLEMNRTTKKNPPKTTTLQIMLSNYDEYQSSANVRQSLIFTDLLPGPTEQGHVYIGFPTHQSTGCSMHLAGHFIPTVERESIDFVDRVLSAWNQELLAMSGIVARILYEHDMHNIKIHFDQLTLDSMSLDYLNKKAIHSMQGFTFQSSTPSPLVCRITGGNFMTASSKTMTIMTTKGVLPASDARILTQDLMFVKNIPVIPQIVFEGCRDLMQYLLSTGVLRNICWADIALELQSRALPTDDLVLFLQWCMKQRWNPSEFQQCKSLVRWEQKNLSISQIKYFTSSKVIPPELPLMDSVLDLAISRHFSANELSRYFWDWTELQLSTWVEFIVNHESFNKNLDKIMSTIGRHFNNLDATQRVLITSRLEQTPCIVTNQGILKPQLCYFPSVDLFKDLPIVSFHSKISDQFLKALGVRETVDLQILFDRINDLNWDQVQMIKYLASVQDKLTDMEWKRLQISPLFLSEQDKKRYPASKLYIPTDVLRNLGQNVMMWTGKWKKGTDYSKFMEIIGLREFIPLNQLFKLAAENDKQRLEFLRYFIDNIAHYKDYNPRYATVDFLPTNAGLSKPIDCFSDQDVIVMGFRALVPELVQHAKIFGVEDCPSATNLYKALLETPPNADSATKVFSFLASKQYLFSSSHWVNLKTAKFIPVNGVLMAPVNVYFLNSTNLYKDVFTYVDFGPAANSFLRACGCKDEPSIQELSKSVVSTPQDFFILGVDTYLGILRQIAANYATISSNDKKSMRDSKFLLGVQTLEKEPKYTLEKAKDVYLIDDTILSQLFKPIGAPVDDLLESMYQDLGARWLSTQVSVEHSIKGQPISTNQSNEIQQLIHSRSKLLLYDGHQIRKGKDLQPNAATLLSKIKVYQIPKIDVILKFKNEQKIQNTTSCLTTIGRDATILLTEEFDYFDLATTCSKLYIVNPRLNDILLISTLLSDSLENLNRKGFPVDRILQKTKVPNMTNDLQVIKLVRELESIFLDADPDYLKQMVLKMWPAEIEVIVDHLLTNGYPKKPLSKQLQVMHPDVSPNVIEKTIKSNPNSSVNQISDILKTSEPRKDTLPSQQMKDVNTKEISQTPKSMFEKQAKEFSDLFSSFTRNLTFGNSDVNTRVPDIRPENSKLLKSQLQNAIASSQSANTSTIQGQIKDESPPVIQNQCTVISDNDLVLKDCINGISIYIDKQCLDQGLEAIQNVDAISRFSKVVLFLAKVFELPQKSLHIYWDFDGKTIAFNRNRALFFNYRYYLGLHYERGIPGSFQSSESRQCYYFWFMTFCHELAHHFVTTHDTRHEHYLSSFAENYMGKLHDALGQIP